MSAHTLGQGTVLRLWDGRLTLDVADKPTPLWQGRTDEYHEQPHIAVTQLVVTADATNTGVIVLGYRLVTATAATRTGLVLDIDEERSIVTPIDLRMLYATASTAGDGLFFSYYAGAPAGDEL